MIPSLHQDEIDYNDFFIIYSSFGKISNNKFNADLGFRAFSFSLRQEEKDPCSKNPF
jgi:hypothetical protein